MNDIKQDEPQCESAEEAYRTTSNYYLARARCARPVSWKTFWFWHGSMIATLVAIALCSWLMGG